MTQLDCPPFPPNSRLTPAQRLRWITGRPAFVLASAIVVSALGCREDAESPTAPEPESAVATMAAALVFRQLSAGTVHTCGVTNDDKAYCWGWNGDGQLGDGTVTDRLTPVPVLGGLRFRQVSAGHGHTCGVTTTQRAFCWGWNGYGQVGDGTTTEFHLTPEAVAGGLAFAQLDAGTYHTCGVTTVTRHAYCWGLNEEGQLGDGTTAQRPRPRAVLGGRPFRQVSAAGFHTCGVTTADLAFCWGNNRYGQLGDSTEVGSRLYPVRVAGGRRFRQVAAGGLDAASEHTCGVTTGGRALCWGNGTRGQLGNGKEHLSFWPRRVVGSLTFERVTAGGYHTCGETTDNRAYCWGDNGYGPLGDGTDTQRLIPVPVVGGRYFSQLSAGGFHTCGRTSRGVAYCWGANTYGGLGDGTTDNRLTSVPVAGPTE